MWSSDGHGWDHFSYDAAKSESDFQNADPTRLQTNPPQRTQRRNITSSQTKPTPTSLFGCLLPALCQSEAALSCQPGKRQRLPISVAGQSAGQWHCRTRQAGARTRRSWGSSHPAGFMHSNHPCVTPAQTLVKSSNPPKPQQKWDLCNLQHFKELNSALIKLILSGFSPKLEYFLVFSHLFLRFRLS